jgi:predicted RND superfamily exporter protein
LRSAKGGEHDADAREGETVVVIEAKGQEEMRVRTLTAMNLATVIMAGVLFATVSFWWRWLWLVVAVFSCVSIVLRVKETND